MGNRYLHHDCVEVVNAYLGIDTLHPYVSVIDLRRVSSINHHPNKLDMYAVCCRPMYEVCDTTDGAERVMTHAELSIYAPGTITNLSGDREHSLEGWLLVFHSEIMKDTIVEHYLGEYSFFQSPHRYNLDITPEEYVIIENCMRSINVELNQPLDTHTKNILVSGIIVLLSLCMRFYNRQNSRTKDVDKQRLVMRLDRLLNSHIASNDADKQLPTVQWCANQLHLSANYFGDLVRRDTGMSAQHYIQQRLMNEAKLMLHIANIPISEIAYRLGYKYPHHLSRVFKQVVGCTPNKYRSMIK